ncbi:hypothetical protein BDAP_001811 [Binucleata daphniae]
MSDTECKLFKRDEDNILYYGDEVVFTPKMRNDHKFVDKNQKFDIEKLLRSTKPIDLHKSDAKVLLEAKERYKEELEAAYIIRKYEILEDLKLQQSEFMELMNNKLCKLPLIMVLNALEKKHDGFDITIKNKIDDNKLPTIVVSVDDETYIISKNGLQIPIEANNENTKFAKQLQKLYNFHYIYKIG